MEEGRDSGEEHTFGNTYFSVIKRCEHEVVSRWDSQVRLSNRIDVHTDCYISFDSSFIRPSSQYFLLDQHLRKKR